MKKFEELRLNVRFSEGRGCGEMRSLDFVGRAEDLAFHGPAARGKIHVATVLSIEATRRWTLMRLFQTAALPL
ncbi:ATP-binding protein [Thermophilibacter sp.]